ncbi:TPA: hypothetical protein QDB26_005340 [Burkholderia vietnamiensis]|nr:hypothetical protein [Burkholderia vietnamiensis]HDR9216550.1 hypothetical protein [Burkholderia vietnamiensis]
MTERNEQTPAESEASDFTGTACLIAGDVCGETPANRALNDGINNEEDQNVPH